MSGKIFDPTDLFQDFRTAKEKRAQRFGDQRDGKVYGYTEDLVLAINVALVTGRPLLLRGQPGITIMALLSGAPILPLVHYGHENYRKELPQLRRSQIHTIVGRTFWLDSHEKKVTGEIRQQMTDEIMYQLAMLLPPAYRGVYGDLSKATQVYLRFTTDAETNVI